MALSSLRLPELLGSTLLELGRRKAKNAIIGVCTAGGMATAAWLQRQKPRVIVVLESFQLPSGEPGPMAPYERQNRGRAPTGERHG
ncbi:MAG: hypothetical protein ABMA14_13655 [Hyphomonadaceae bacterium]